MTNEYVAEHFSVVWNGKPDAYLCVQRDDDVIRRDQVKDIFAEHHRAMPGQRR